MLILKLKYEVLHRYEERSPEPVLSSSSADARSLNVFRMKRINERHGDIPGSSVNLSSFQEILPVRSF
jgi:hypothetical protein